MHSVLGKLSEEIIKTPTSFQSETSTNFRLQEIYVNVQHIPQKFIN